eukprot:5269387-Pleurochrysis_carterae.AAC.1
MKAEKPFGETVSELRAELVANGADSTAVSRNLVVNALLALFPDEEVGTVAMQVHAPRARIAPIQRGRDQSASIRTTR